MQIERYGEMQRVQGSQSIGEAVCLNETLSHFIMSNAKRYQPEPAPAKISTKSPQGHQGLRRGNLPRSRFESQDGLHLQNAQSRDETKTRRVQNQLFRFQGSDF